MNNLNSLILEGVVVGEPHYEELGGSGRVNFTIETYRYYKTRDGNDATEKSQFKVVGYGKLCATPLINGSSIRLVDRLRQSVWSTDGVTHSEVQVIAEHIEMRAKK